jgi:hypothetical protein
MNTYTRQSPPRERKKDVDPPELLRVPLDGRILGAKSSAIKRVLKWSRKYVAPFAILTDEGDEHRYLG